MILQRSTQPIQEYISNTILCLNGAEKKEGKLYNHLELEDFTLQPFPPLNSERYFRGKNYLFKCNKYLVYYPDSNQRQKLITVPTVGLCAPNFS